MRKGLLFNYAYQDAQNKKQNFFTSFVFFETNNPFLSLVYTTTYKYTIVYEAYPQKERRRRKMNCYKTCKKKAFCIIAVICMILALSLTFVGCGTSNSMEMQGIKIVEIYSRVNESGTIDTDFISSPREIDDYHLTGIYGVADVPYEICELRLEDSEAFDSYPDATSKYEAISMAISDEVCAGLIKGQAVFFTGADGDTALGVASGVRRAYPNLKLGVISLDACGDISSIAAVMGVGDAQTAYNLASDNQAVFDALMVSDARDFDDEAQVMLSNLSSSVSYYSNVDTETFKDGDSWAKAVNEFAENIDVIYLHIDADVLHQGYISHIDTGSGEGPDIWTLMNNVQTVMETGKVAAVNLASMYTDDPGIETVVREPIHTEEMVTELELVYAARGYEIPQYHEWETTEELINRFSSMSIRTALRIASTAIGNWSMMPKAPNAVIETPQQVKDEDSNIEGLKVVEIESRNASPILVSRNMTEPLNTENPTYAYEERGNIIDELDHIYPYQYPVPREIEDYKLMDLYSLAGVNYDIVHVDTSDEEVAENYEDLANFEGLCKEVSDEVYSGLTEGKTIFLDGMGCMPSTGVAGGMRRAFGDDVRLGIIYIDNHGDINTCDSTLSGGTGGMCVAPIMGIDPHETAQHWWNTSSDSMKPFDELLHCAARNLDSGIDDYDPNNVYTFSEEQNILKAVSEEKFYMSSEEFEDTEYFKEVLEDFASKVDVIYLHIDMDALDTGCTLNSGSADGGYYNGLPGPDIWEMMDNAKAVLSTGKVAVVNLCSVMTQTGYGSVPENIMFKRGFAFPAVAEEVTEGTPEEIVVNTNRVSSYGILQGIRMTSSILSNWNTCVLPKHFQ